MAWYTCAGHFASFNAASAARCLPVSTQFSAVPAVVARARATSKRQCRPLADGDLGGLVVVVVMVGGRPQAPHRNAPSTSTTTRHYDYYDDNPNPTTARLTPPPTPTKPPQPPFVPGAQFQHHLLPHAQRAHASSFRSQSNGKRSNRFITIVVHCRCVVGEGGGDTADDADAAVAGIGLIYLI